MVEIHCTAFQYSVWIRLHATICKLCQSIKLTFCLSFNELLSVPSKNLYYNFRELKRRHKDLTHRWGQGHLQQKRVTNVNADWEKLQPYRPAHLKHYQPEEKQKMFQNMQIAEITVLHHSFRFSLRIKQATFSIMFGPKTCRDNVFSR